MGNGKCPSLCSVEAERRLRAAVEAARPPHQRFIVHGMQRASQRVRPERGSRARVSARCCTACQGHAGDSRCPLTPSLAQMLSGPVVRAPRRATHFYRSECVCLWPRPLAACGRASEEEGATLSLSCLNGPLSFRGALPDISSSPSFALLLLLPLPIPPPPSSPPLPPLSPRPRFSCPAPPPTAASRHRQPVSPRYGSRLHFTSGGRPALCE